MDTTNYTSEEPTVELRVLHIILALIGLFDQLFMVNFFFNEAKYRISWKYLMASKAIAGAIYCIAHIILQILNLYGMIPMKYCVIVKLCETISLTFIHNTIPNDFSLAMDLDVQKIRENVQQDESVWNAVRFTLVQN
ncbi:hypothetical protein L5515_010090 [Caenorhabditis briggsae]|uniref:Uncharacterized protein n=1 Tax=Caenorhabditis briggsae TaxID=6238 RepID=A0AAE9EPB5_CAEBR|nr:hypothetical protein L5515_010090 [Caenorhabditis briggsae]